MKTKDIDFSAVVGEYVADEICCNCNVSEYRCGGGDWEHSDCPFAIEIEELCEKLTPLFEKLHYITEKAKDFDEDEEAWEAKLEEASIAIDNGYEPRYAYE